MKIRKFYPTQVYRQQNGKRLSGLDTANRHALEIALLRSRKMGGAVTVVDDAIDVRCASELGRLILGDMRAMFKQSFVAGTVVSSVLVRDDLAPA